MNVLSSQLRRVALLGVLLLGAGPSDGAPVGVGGGYAPPGPSAGPGKGQPGAPKPPGSGRQLVLQVRGSG